MHKVCLSVKSNKKIENFKQLKFEKENWNNGEKKGENEQFEECSWKQDKENKQRNIESAEQGI